MKSNVEIKTNSVTVQENGNKKSKNSKPRKRRAKVGKQQQLIPESGPPEGVQSGLSELAPKSLRVGKSNSYNLGDCDPLSEQAKAFFLLHCDPNGEHNLSLDAARVPDGALQASAGAFFRISETIAFPWQEKGSTDLTGKTYSMLFLQFGFFRSLTFILALEKDGEFSNDVLRDFIVAFANYISAFATYPNWTSFREGGYFTVVDNEALRNVVPPDNDGQSGIIDSYRITSQGLGIAFNTPDLVDQGTFVSHRYPLDFSQKALVEKLQRPGSVYEYLLITRSDISINNRVVAFSGPIFEPASIATTPAGTFNTTPWVSDYAFRDFSGDFRVTIGDTVLYRVEGTANSQLVFLVNVTENTNIQVASFPPVFVTGTSASVSFPVERTAGDDVVDEIDDIEVTVVSIPPVTQADILQQNPKAMVELAKETEGVYLPSSLMQPIFNITHASSYRKILLTTKGYDITSTELNPQVGYSDTLDQNYSVSVVNFQGIPYACKPLIKICRSAELVPAPQSILGAFTTGCPPVQDEVVAMCKAFHENQPHGYPFNWNGLGKLFGKALEVVQKLPSLLRLGGNISKSIKKVCDEELVESKSDSFEVLLSQGLKRLMTSRGK
jgi:hypothetical protein